MEQGTFTFPQIRNDSALNKAFWQPLPTHFMQICDMPHSSILDLLFFFVPVDLTETKQGDNHKMQGQQERNKQESP